MLQSIAGWFLKMLLDYLLGLAIKEFKRFEEQVKEDARRDKVNEDNVKKYEESRDRADRIKNALDLLNRTP